MKTQKLTLVGHYGMSLLMDVARFPAVGETVEGLGLEIEPGGKGYNQAIASSRLGADVNFITAVGGDDFGACCDRDLISEKVNGRYIINFPKLKSAYAFVINSADAKSEVYVYPGAIRSVTPEHIELYRGVIEESSLLLLQNEISPEALCKVIEIGGKAKVEIIYNPAPARPMPKEIYQYIHIMTPNETEAALLAGLDPAVPLDVDIAVGRLHKFGVENVIITMGDKGSIVSMKGERYQVKPLEGKVISTTGAGDCYNAALAVKYMETHDVLEAAKYASVASRLQVQRTGVIANLPYKDETDEIYQKVKDSLAEKI